VNAALRAAGDGCLLAVAFLAAVLPLGLNTVHSFKVSFLAFFR
jgi:hypothetical protein